MKNDTSVQHAGPALYGAGAAGRAHRPALIGRIAMLGVLVTPGVALRGNHHQMRPDALRADGADSKGGS